MAIFKISQDQNEKSIEIIKYQELYIKDLQEKIANLTSVIESGKPVCPYCHTELELRTDNKSYLQGGGTESVWKCWCTE
jgi:transposase-like protein